MATLLLPAGITSEASIRYKDEAELLDAASDVDKTYIEEVLPGKMKYNLDSIKNFSFFGDIATMFRTVLAVLGKDYEVDIMEDRKVSDGLVSIIMPSWNTERFIAETIQSVLDQTYTNWELIIVDDCSSDNTDEVVASFKDERIKYLHNDKNSGAALTRNKALREAKGEWIAFS